MEKTGKDLKEAIESNGIEEWQMHNCSICGYLCGYHFKNGKVYYDNGCYCTNNPDNLSPRSWDDVAEQYNMQTNSNIIDKMNDFFNF